MAQHYSNPKRENDPYALPDLEVWYAEQPTHPVAEPGWYYWFCFPGCLPDSDPVGPFASEDEALADARQSAGADDDEPETDDGYTCSCVEPPSADNGWTHDADCDLRFMRDMK